MPDHHHPTRASRAGVSSLFAITVALFLCSALTWVSAPTAALWIVAIVATEWGHYAALVCVVLALLACRSGRLGAATALLACISGVLFVSPVIRATRIAKLLPAQCEAAFGEAKSSRSRAAPLNVADLFRGVPASEVVVTEHLYAMAGPKQLELDLYQQKNVLAPQPLIVMIHGGSWNGGNKEQLAKTNRRLAQEGYSVAAINYRHAPKFKSPAAVEDTFRALDFLKADAEKLHLDISRIVLIGRSAGGQIALSAAYADREPGIQGVVAFYAPADLVLGYDVPSRRLVLNSRKVLEDYLGGSPAQNPDGYAAASPTNFVNASTPPTLLIHGGLDPIVWPHQSEALSERLQQAARPYLYVRLPWATHGCDANLSGPSGQLSLYAIDRFLAAVFAERG